MTASVQHICKVKAFASRCGTDINAVVAPFRCCNLRNQHGADILHLEPAAFKGKHRFHVIIAADAECIVQIRTLLYLDPLLFEALDNLLFFCFIQIAADRSRFFFMHILADLLHCIKAVEFTPALYDPFRHGIGD